jgi:hypothetical protein
VFLVKSLTVRKYCSNFGLKLYVMQINFTELKITVQKAIDCLVQKDKEGTTAKLKEAGEILNELMDFADNDEDLIELSKYQVLLTQLEQKNAG